MSADILSGAKTERPGLTEALSYMRPGDILVVWRLDRPLPVAERGRMCHNISRRWHYGT
jgi:DNA invertase Pin-like site-specific DNA recombinase